MFCICGTLVYVRSDSSRVECPRCKRENSVAMIKPTYTEVKVQRDLHIEAVDVQGAKIKHRCPACGAEEMMYNTAQLRSTDEGQTVFYSCKCGYRQTVQS
ncbi:DNA-DIRECTED RNA POLYMERASE I SUBUNIT M [Encephalitozoon cuniculi GB-M1]|uniref:DNA-directed RNA polymerase I subunit RPA12 n=2 Tax=Encephalitozoon cuniculi TaxID=6035 RepID=Q8SRA1_ENCCU|nr:DNA-directed RNA polymerase I core subunit RPA12 [Encephalitozoon cuniculi GB-M1]AGE95191.1 DNA-directed RNA polymerase I subunit M [Encephalitozoon cuniculi]KMV65662.1 DNA-directed RNA polymerase subunit M [Encephalitozoon cuniculi EcunIII-L]UYI27065.1 DNA-directed RNA polymerase I subunit RPA12 [Encephalitozoon cuniculi]CAD26438.1 DNA-DIRECTED RNA POLYMERASE I SUBUNIT M [Encephalitozoon cuniculi GB-M1]